MLFGWSLSQSLGSQLHVTSDDVSSKPIGANIRQSQINGYLSTTGGPQPHFYKTNPVDHTMLLIFGLAYLFVYSKIRRSVADNK